MVKPRRAAAGPFSNAATPVLDLTATLREADAVAEVGRPIGRMTRAGVFARPVDPRG